MPRFDPASCVVSSMFVDFFILVARFIRKALFPALLANGRNDSLTVASRDEHKRTVFFVDIKNVHENFGLCQTLWILMKQLAGDVLFFSRARNRVNQIEAIQVLDCTEIVGDNTQ